ncbi:MAG: ABC transporter substrate-binding protein [Planctomycetota bacterium]
MLDQFMSVVRRGAQRWNASVKASVVAAVLACLLPGVVQQAAAQSKVIPLPIRTDGPKSLDPVAGSTVYDNTAVSQFYETLLETAYYDNYVFEPLLLAEMPERLDDGLRYRFRLKDGVRFKNDPCFPGGVGRELVTDDVFYSWKRLADRDEGLENWWLMAGVIQGLEPQPEGEAFDYDADVSGLVKIDDKNFEVVLNKPVYRFLWVLTMFQTSVVPREAVEYYGDDFAASPVGTGPFVLDEWVPKSHLYVNRNPDYRDERYPAADKWSEEDREKGLADAAGQRIPFADRLEFTFYIEDQPLWLEFQQGKLAYIEVPYPFFSEGFSSRTKRLNRELRRAGVTYRSEPQLDFIFRAFNMDDELLGANGPNPERARHLRRAISFAIDFEEFNTAFYEGLCVLYDGPIPPGLDGHPEGGRVPGAPRGPDRAAARAELEAAGFPNGEGLPPIKFYTSQGGTNADQVEMMRRQLSEVGITLEPILLDFSQLIELTNKRQAPFFGFAWSSDYPDAENNLALFYSENASPGSNHSNYNNPEFDELYLQAIQMEPSPERTALYERLRNMVIEDTPYVGALARTRYWLMAPWVLNARPTQRTQSWFKYLDVDEDER